jgi:D-alanine-D-alanine ligase
LIEEYIEGRELYLSVLGNQRLTVMPPREIFFEGMPEDGPRFATAHAKWNMDYRERWNIMNGPAEPMTDEIRRKLDRVAKKVYRVLNIRGFGRLDVRLTAEGQVYVIEANPNPSLDEIEDFSQAALEGGLTYDTLIQEILNAA